MGASFKKGAQIYEDDGIDEVRSESSGHSILSGKTGLTGVSGHSHGSKGSNWSKNTFRKKKKNTDEFVSLVLNNAYPVEISCVT
jgi:hypothetical protein